MRRGLFLLYTFIQLFLVVSVTCTAADTFFGIIGTSMSFIEKERAAGVSCKVVRISWKDFFPDENRPDQKYITQKKFEINKLRSAGFGIIPDLGDDLLLR